MSFNPLPTSYETTRVELQRVATHVLARRRFDLGGKFGLRATPAGIGTPAFGPEHEVVRVSGTRLVRETTGQSSATTSVDLRSATLGEAAALVGVDLTRPFEAGHDTPPLGDATALLDIDPASAAVLAEWFQFGWTVLDAAVGGLGASASPSVVQLWPEHFDAGCDVAADGTRVNLGTSPGDSFSAQPYLYVGPWESRRPGDPGYWNAPFGAVLTYEDLRGMNDPATVAVAFFLKGIALLGTHES